MSVSFTPELAAFICEGVESGRPLKSLAEEIGVAPGIISRWQRLHPVFAESVKHARASAAHLLVEEARAITDGEVIDGKPSDVRRDQLRANVRMQIAGLWNRKDYGQQVDLNITERVDLGGTLIEARKRSDLLPLCDLAQRALPQVVDDAQYAVVETADMQSVPLAVPLVNPFD